MTSLPMLLAAVFLGTERLFLKNRWRERFSPIAASMFVKFECFNLLGTDVHVKMNLGENTLNNETLSLLNTKFRTRN